MQILIKADFTGYRSLK